MMALFVSCRISEPSLTMSPLCRGVATESTWQSEQATRLFRSVFVFCFCFICLFLCLFIFENINLDVLLCGTFSFHPCSLPFLTTVEQVSIGNLRFKFVGFRH